MVFLRYINISLSKKQEAGQFLMVKVKMHVFHLFQLCIAA